MASFSISCLGRLQLTGSTPNQTQSIKVNGAVMQLRVMHVIVEGLQRFAEAVKGQVSPLSRPFKCFWKSFWGQQWQQHMSTRLLSHGQIKTAGWVSFTALWPSSWSPQYSLWYYSMCRVDSGQCLSNSAIYINKAPPTPATVSQMLGLLLPCISSIENCYSQKKKKTTTQELGGDTFALWKTICCRLLFKELLSVNPA